MVIRNPFRSRYRAIYGVSLAACAFTGCSVYTDELLRHPSDAGASLRDATHGSDDATAKDGAPGADGRPQDEGDAKGFDAATADAGAGNDAGATTDGPPR